jgi:phosphopantothenate synthetase
MQRKNTIAESLKKQGKELDLDAMKKQIEALHQPEGPTIAVPKAVVAMNAERVVRLSVDTPENVYLALKSKVLRDKTNIKEYVLELIKRDLGF